MRIWWGEITGILCCFGGNTDKWGPTCVANPYQWSSLLRMVMPIDVLGNTFHKICSTPLRNRNGVVEIVTEWSHCC